MPKENKTHCGVGILVGWFFNRHRQSYRKIMETKHVCKLPYSVPLTSWSEALLLLLLVDVLPLSRLAGLEAKWKMRRHRDEQTCSRRRGTFRFCSQNAARQESCTMRRQSMPMPTKRVLTDRRAKGFPGGPRGCFREGHDRNSTVQGRGQTERTLRAETGWLVETRLSQPKGWPCRELLAMRSLTTHRTRNPAHWRNATTRRSKSICTDNVLHSYPIRGRGTVTVFRSFGADFKWLY